MRLAELNATEIGVNFDEGIFTVAVRRTGGRTLDPIQQHTTVNEDAAWALLVGLLREHQVDNPRILISGYAANVLTDNAHSRKRTAERDATARISNFGWDADSSFSRSNGQPLYDNAGSQRIHQLQVALRGGGLIPALGDETKLLKHAFAFERATGGGAIHYPHPDHVAQLLHASPNLALAAMLTLGTNRPLVDPPVQSLADYDPFQNNGHNPFDSAAGSTTTTNYGGRA